MCSCILSQSQLLYFHFFARLQNVFPFMTPCLIEFLKKIRYSNEVATTLLLNTSKGGGSNGGLAAAPLSVSGSGPSGGAITKNTSGSDGGAVLPEATLSTHLTVNVLDWLTLHLEGGGGVWCIGLLRRDGVCSRACECCCAIVPFLALSCRRRFYSSALFFSFKVHPWISSSPHSLVYFSPRPPPLFCLFFDVFLLLHDVLHCVCVV